MCYTWKGCLQIGIAENKVKCFSFVLKILECYRKKTKGKLGRKNEITVARLFFHLYYMHNFFLGIYFVLMYEIKLIEQWYNILWRTAYISWSLTKTLTTERQIFLLPSLPPLEEKEITSVQMLRFPRGLKIRKHNLETG